VGGGNEKRMRITCGKRAFLIKMVASIRCGQLVFYPVASIKNAG